MFEVKAGRVPVSLETLEPRVLLSATPGASEVFEITTDDHGDTAATATSAVIGEDVTGVIDPVADLDVFEYQVKADHWYEFDINDSSSQLVAVGRLLAADGTTQLKASSSGFTWEAQTDTTVYLEVASYHGSPISYEVLSREIVDKHGDSAATATPLEMGQHVTGREDPEGDDDWFSFEAIKGFDYVIEGLDAHAWVIDTDGETRLAQTDVDVAVWTDPFVFTAPHTGTFYLHIHHYHEYGYEFTINEEPGNPPEVVWETFLPDSSVRGVEVDSDGAIYVTGETTGEGWTSGGFDTSYGGDTDAFVAKFSADGQMIWSTYVGGAGLDAANDIAIDEAGDVYITGRTQFGTWGDADPLGGGLSDAFAAKISSDGEFIWSTWLGGTGEDVGTGITVDEAGQVYVAAETLLPRPPHGSDAPWQSGFVSKLASDGAELWTNDAGFNAASDAVVVDADGNVYLVANYWPIDGFVTKYAADGTFLWTSDTFHNSEFEQAVVGSDGIYLVGTAGFDETIVVVKLSFEGEVVWSERFGEYYQDSGFGIAIDGDDNLYVTGSTGNYAWVSGGWDSNTLGSGSFVMKLDSNGEHIWSSFYDYGAFAIAVDDAGAAFIVGRRFQRIDGEFELEGTVTRVQEDDHGEHPLSATPMTVGAPQQGVIEFASDIDVFSFNAVAGQNHMFRLNGLSGGVLRVLNADGDVLASSEDHRGNRPLVWKSAESGTFYIEVATNGSGIGSYSVESTALGNDRGRGKPADHSVALDQSVIDLAMHSAQQETRATKQSVLDRLLERLDVKASVLSAIS